MQIVVAFSEYIELNLAQTEKIAIVKNGASYKFFDCRFINASWLFVWSQEQKVISGLNMVLCIRLQKIIQRIKVGIALNFCFYNYKFPQNLQVWEISA